MVRFHSERLINEYIAITDHSRDGSPEKAFKGITEWFKRLYFENETWLQKKFGKIENLSQEELDEIEKLAAEKAEQLAFYKDERLKQVLKEIEEIEKTNLFPDIKVFKGIEVNLLPDGSFDTSLVEKGQFEIVNYSIHKNVDKEAFEPIFRDPKKYTDLVLKGIKNPKTNIICHIGYGCENEIIENLDWDKIGKFCLENKVAIEINLGSLLNLIYKEILNFEKFPKNNPEYRNFFKEKLPKCIPILFSSKIRNQLKPYIKEGLIIAFNTDERWSPYVKGNITKEGKIVEQFKDFDFRFWYVLKLTEKYLNEIFTEMEIKSTNILNVQSKEEVIDFFKKNP